MTTMRTKLPLQLIRGETNANANATITTDRRQQWIDTTISLKMLTMITWWRCGRRVDESALMDDDNAAMTTNHQSTAHKISAKKLVVVSDSTLTMTMMAMGMEEW